MVSLQNFICKLRYWYNLVQHNKKATEKVSFSRFIASIIFVVRSISVLVTYDGYLKAILISFFFFLQFFVRSFPLVNDRVREALGDTFYEEFMVSPRKRTTCIYLAGHLFVILKSLSITAKVSKITK